MDLSEMNQGMYFTLDEGKQATVVLSNWRMEKTQFEKEPEKSALVFDVINIDGEDCDTPKTYSTRSYLLAKEFNAIIERAEDQGAETIRVVLKKNMDGRYMVIDHPFEQKVTA